MRWQQSGTPRTTNPWWFPIRHRNNNNNRNHNNRNHKRHPQCPTKRLPCRLRSSSASRNTYRRGWETSDRMLSNTPIPTNSCWKHYRARTFPFPKTPSVGTCSVMFSETRSPPSEKCFKRQAQQVTRTTRTRANRLQLEAAMQLIHPTATPTISISISITRTRCWISKRRWKRPWRVFPHPPETIL